MIREFLNPKLVITDYHTPSQRQDAQSVVSIDLLSFEPSGIFQLPFFSKYPGLLRIRAEYHDACLPLVSSQVSCTQTDSLRINLLVPPV